MLMAQRTALMVSEIGWSRSPVGARHGARDPPLPVAYNPARGASSVLERTAHGLKIQSNR